MPFQRGNKLWKVNIGRKRSEETKQKLRESIKRAYKNGLKFGFQKGHKPYKNNGQFKKGQIPWNYINGKSKSREYHKEEWIELAKKVYERDNYECQDCGKKGGRLNAHHIKMVTKYPTLS